VRVAFSWSVRFETLPALGQAFSARHPDVQLLTQEMWNADMGAALRSGAIDVAISLCPELADDIADEVIRAERVVAILAVKHSLAGEEAISLPALADDEFVLFPRELAPRLHDVMVGIYRHAGFEPKVRSESFHTGWDLLLLADSPVVAIAPQSVSGELPEGLVAVPLSEPADALETRLLWREDNPSPAAHQFLAAARTVYDPVRSAIE
jgi:DNA-binding transcriptional LysR family regulator